MSAPAAHNKDHEPPGRSAAGRGRSNPYDAKPPKNELEFRDYHLRRATDDERTNKLYIRLRWHQAAMGLVYTAGAVLPVVVVIGMSKLADLSADQIMQLVLIASGGAGAGATASWLVRRRTGGRLPPGGHPGDGRAP